ncbi:MAG: autotransporter-associated beta strand repeat-containing protein, partial [Planctomycetota bacterium]|nr:autotransporter-associated beta strand repeat-containing protein [Planctomycetota bacterium]
MLTMRKVRSFLAAAVVAMVLLPGLSARAGNNILLDHSFLNSVSPDDLGWGIGRTWAVSEAGVVLGNPATQEGMMSIAAPSGLSFVNSGVEMRFIGTDAIGNNEGYAYISMYADQNNPPRNAYGITAANFSSTGGQLTQSVNNGTSGGELIDRMPLVNVNFVGEHTMALVRFDDNTLTAYLDGVEIGSRTTTAPSLTLQNIGVGANYFGGATYLPRGTVVSRVRAFTFASGAFDSSDLLALTLATVWSGNSSTGNAWNVGENWVGNSVPGPNASIKFGEALSNPAVDLNISATVGTMFFVQDVPTTISTSNDSVLTLDNGLDATTVTVAGTSQHAISTNVTLGQHTWIKVENPAGGLTFSGAIGDGGADKGIIKKGPGLLTLSNAANTYGGGTTVNDGTLQVGAQGALPDDTPVTITGGTLELGGTAVTSTAAVSFQGGVTQNGIIINNGSDYDGQAGTVSASLQGAAGLNKTTGGTLVLSGANTYTGNTTLSAGTINLGVEENAGVSGPLGKQNADAAGTIILSGGTLQHSASNANDYSGRFSTADNQAYNVDTNGRTVTWGAALSSSGGTLTKLGDGTLALGVANTYTGNTRIVAGTLQVGHSLALQQSTLDMKGTDAGTLDLNGMDATLGGLKGSRDLTVPTNKTLSVGNNDASTQYSGVIGGDGNLSKVGSGTLTLSKTQTYTGSTIITGGGTLKLQGASAAPPVTDYAHWFDASSLGLSDGAAVTEWTSGGTIGGTATVPGGNQNPTYIADAGTGTGLGAVHFNAGGGAGSSEALMFTRDSEIRTVFSIFKGSSFLLTDADAYDFHRPSNDVPTDPLWVGWTSDRIRNGQTYVNGNLVNGETYNMPTDSYNGYNLVEVLTNGDPVQADSFNKDRVYHAGDQSQAEVILYDRVLTDEERLQVETYLNAKWFEGGLAGGGLPTGTAVTMSSNTTLDLNGVNQQIGSLADAAPGATGHRVLLGSGNLTVGNASSPTFSGAVSGTGSLAKIGTGTLTLSGANTYTGATNITAGTLLVNGTHTDGDNYTVGDTGTLGGTGTITLAPGKTVTVQLGGTLAPGASVGTLTINNSVTIADGGMYQWEINDATGAAGTGWDLLKLLNSGSALDLTSVGPLGLTIEIHGLTSGGDPGAPANFAPGTEYDWTIASAEGGILGFDAGQFAFS